MKKRKSIKKILPNKPSKLIRLAIKDLESIEKSKHYYIEMSFWHKPFRFENICAVCFSGSIMAKTLKSNKKLALGPDDFSITIRNKLIALNEFRLGDVNTGLGIMGLNVDINLNRFITSYSKNPEQFKKEILELANDLEKEGL